MTCATPLSVSENSWALRPPTGWPPRVTETSSSTTSTRYETLVDPERGRQQRRMRRRPRVREHGSWRLRGLAQPLEQRHVHAAHLIVPPRVLVLLDGDA